MFPCRPYRSQAGERNQRPQHNRPESIGSRVIASVPEERRQGNGQTAAAGSGWEQVGEVGVEMGGVEGEADATACPACVSITVRSNAVSPVESRQSDGNIAEEPGNRPKSHDIARMTH